MGQASTRTLAGAVVTTAATRPAPVTVAHADSIFGVPPAALALGAIDAPRRDAAHRQRPAQEAPAGQRGLERLR